MEILHQRFAHINKNNLHNILKNTITTEQYNNNNNNNNSCLDCEICLRVEFPNKCYKESTNKIQYNYLEKISSDICDPFRYPTYDGKKYFITFLDKKSRYLEVRLLANMIEVLEIFLEFKATAENNHKGYKIRVFQCDNGTEYKRLLRHLIKEGIITQLSPPYTPEPNGLLERINRTIIAKVRAVLLQSNTLIYLWGEAVLAIAYIYNRTPHSSLGFKTPYEVAFNIKPNIDNIKIWGLIIYYKIKGPNNYKLHLQAQQGILIGYGQDSHNYKIFNINNKRALWSRDVRIIEGKF